MATGNFAERLKEALDLRGMKQSELAEKAHLEKTLITAYLKGRYKAKADKLYAIAKVLNVSEPWLMGLDVPMERKPVATSNGQASELSDIFSKLTPDRREALLAAAKALLQTQE